VKSQPFGPLDPANYRESVRRALAEDFGWGDVTTDATVPADARGRGTFLAKAPCVVAGLDVAAEVFRQLDPAVVFTVHHGDGSFCQPGTVIAVVDGLARPLLTAERTALNYLLKLSGIATVTRRYVEAAAGRIIVLDTRKTTPGLRLLEKYAVRAGGGTNHRLALDDGILIKDNHIRLAGGVAAAMTAMRAAQCDMPIEIEAQSLEQLDEALAAGATRILADNLSIGANIFLGREPMRKAFGFLPVLDRKAMAVAAKQTMSRLDFHVSRLEAPVSNFSGGQRQAVAIGRAVYWDAQILIMDEPTAALGVPEQRKVISLIHQLKAQGRGVIFISHNLQDIFAVSDRIVVLRRGVQAGERKISETNHDEVVKLMVGG